MQTLNVHSCSIPRELIVPVFSPSINSGTEFLSTLPKPKTIPAKTVLLEQNQRSSFVFVIRSGIVKLTCISEDGQETLLGLRSEGWWAGAPVALLNIPSIITVTAVTSCSVSSIPMSEFSQALIQNQRMLRHFIASQSRELMVEQMHGIMQTCSAAARLAHLENELENSAWQTVDPSSVMRQGEIAKLLDITPEHLSRLLHKRRVRIGPKRALTTEPTITRVA